MSGVTLLTNGPNGGLVVWVRNCSAALVSLKQWPLASLSGGLGTSDCSQNPRDALIVALLNHHCFLSGPRADRRSLPAAAAYPFPAHPRHWPPLFQSTSLPDTFDHVWPLLLIVIAVCWFCSAVGRVSCFTRTQYRGRDIVCLLGSSCTICPG